MDIALIAGANTGNINFAPATEYEEIMQNLRTILATPVYSVPLDRAFGVDMAYVDKPLPIAKAHIESEIVKAIRRYEPRVTVTHITWEGNGEDGALKPKVQVRINGTA
ncbi:GPW/gp25 family protein [Megasphaera stantonii]|uniref:GPW/gp25 family protein n=1 Tax=Megasphaera stantonii TaxID=2144175 RepID=UPI00195E0381|nr:GPW/gp25 family protein [Megasphaera stantonii]MBM6732916.1 GPW/gp25 family protein [Megasphaera stantonii]